MKTVRVKPIAGGWIVDSDAALEPLVFTGGAQAERSAKTMARVVAQEGPNQAQVVVHDRSGVIVGSIVYGPGQ